ncbi:zinc carboxypeptidase [Thozetella sp. PMI_491]|nr:zinc carboxypeptidase [Thozetella sp. PMI_491]
MRISTAVIWLLFPAANVAARKPDWVSYDGYKVFRLAVGEQVGKVSGIVDRLGLATWKSAPRANAMADIVVPPHLLDVFLSEIEGMQAITMHEDLGASIAKESNFNVYAAGSANSSWFSSFHPYKDHVQFLQDLAVQYPLNTEIVTSGTSLQGNNITGIHIFGSSGKGIKPAVVFHGTVHACEWIANMVVEYFAYNLLTNYNSSSEIKGFVEKYDFYMFPVTNPDGFLYSQTTDRMWRKNRQSTSGSRCVGHDINRNWPFKWSVPGGASTDPCASNYRGIAESDTPEVTALASWLKGIKATQGLKLYIDYHSYSQLFMTPYGYSCSAVAVKNAELQSLAKGVAAAVRAVHGTVFDYGPICTTIYQATGSSVDYVNDVVGSDYTFTSELRDTGHYGFVLPADQILPSGEEAFAGVRYLLLNMK